MSTWQVDSSDALSESRMSNASDVPLKWAHDALTGEPRYIHDNEIVERKCSCICPACQLSLTPILAGQPLRTRPTAHFRHPAGSQKDACILVAARLAATYLLLENGFIELPRRAMSRTATGFSGQGYEVWVEQPAEKRTVRGAWLYDYATAELTLDDGRKLLVDLTGQREPATSFDGQAVVTISLSDPELAMLSPEEIRSRLRILPDIHWCAHWNDRALADNGDAQVKQAACDAMDDWNAEDEADFQTNLPPDVDKEAARSLRRETLLHREVKAILEREKRIATPGLDVKVTREAPDEFRGEWEPDHLRMTWLTVPRMLELDDVKLEKCLGRIVPDVIANLGGRQIYTTGITSTWVNCDFQEETEDTSSMAWPQTLLVEVTVTHGIDEIKRQRIRELNLATLEIDLSLLGGRVTLDGLRDLIVNQTVGKQWVHHPIFPIKHLLLTAALDAHPVTRHYHERLIELRRPRLLAMPVTYWATRYLEAVAAFHDKNVAIGKAQRQHQSDAWANIAEAAEALLAHGLPGADDPAMLDRAGLITRILSIQRNKGVGYDVSSGYEVLNAIMQSGKDNKRWDTLFAIAVKAYDLETHFTPDQTRKYEDWRKTLIAKIKANDEAYLRPATFDAVLSLLFPEMTDSINKGYGRLLDTG